MGGKGRGKGRRDSSGSHIQGPQQDKFDPNWKPRRGGKKARKQAEVYQRKYLEWLQSVGVPAHRETQPEEISSSSGFPDFPGELERLAELDDLLPGEVEVTVLEAPGSSSDRPKSSSVAKLSSVVPSEPSAPKSSASRPAAPLVRAPPTQYSSPPGPKVGKAADPSGKVVSPVPAPVPSKAIPQKARPVQGVPEPKEPPKGVESKAKGCVVKVPEPKEPPKSKPRLSGSVVDLSAADASSGIPRAVGLPPPPAREVRFCLDFNGTINCNHPGSPQLDQIAVGAADAILECLQNSPSHKVAICSYIGLYGRRSLERRRSLKVQVIYLNRWLSLQGIPASQHVSLQITTSRDKVELTSDLCHSHLDDKWSTYQSVGSRGVDAVLFDSRTYPNTESVDSVSAYFQKIQNRATPRAFNRPFFTVPTAATVVDR